MASQAKFVTITLADGTVCDGILLSPAADTGEGSATPLVIPLDRGGGAAAPVEAVQSAADADVYAEA